MSNIDWIPVTERLPESKPRHIGELEKLYIVCFDRKYAPMEFLHYYEGWNCSGIIQDDGTIKVSKDSEIDGVIAWAEMPEPYKLKKEYNEDE